VVTATRGNGKNAEHYTDESEEDDNGHDVDNKNKHTTEAEFLVLEARDSQGFIE
jgi:hypothetical protein